MAADIRVMGQAYTDVLTIEQRDALHIACSVLTDNFFGDIIDLGAQDAEFADTDMGSYLPQRYLPFYSLGFAKQFLVTFTTVCWKLAQPGRLMLSSLAEELALVVLLEEANEQLDSMQEDIHVIELAEAEESPKALLEEEGEDNSEEDGPFYVYWPFVESVLEDVDVMMLYDDQFDGIDQTELAEQMGLPSLSLEKWFVPFAERIDTEYGVVHPYVLDDERVKKVLAHEEGE